MKDFTLKDVMTINPDALRAEQERLFRAAVSDRLRGLADDVKCGRFSKVKDSLKESPIGTCEDDRFRIFGGSTNHYIDFSDLFDGDDLMDAMNKLQELNKPQTETTKEKSEMSRAELIKKLGGEV